MYLHFILVVENKEWMTGKEEENELYCFIDQLVNRLGHKSLVVNGIPGHLHLLMEFNPYSSPDQTIREIKEESTCYVNSRKWMNAPFCWKPGYGAFTYSGSQIRKALAYIRNQEEFHKNQTLKDEYPETLRNNDTHFGNKILFDFVDI
jgi:REP element-mobilizing transposase RayT